MVSFRFFYVRRAVVLWWAAALLVGALTFLLVARSGAVASSAVAAHGRTRLVPVAVRAVGAGEVVGAGDVARRPVPVAFLPREPVAAPAAGRVAVVPIAAGEVVLASKLAPAGLRGAAALVPPGWRAVTIAGGPTPLPPVAVGARVDVLATSEDGRTAVVAPAAVVVAVADPADSVTVAVPAELAPAVAAATALAVVTLALVGA